MNSPEPLPPALVAPEPLIEENVPADGAIIAPPAAAQVFLLGPPALAVGDVVNAGLEIRTTDDLADLALHLRYDPALFELVEASPGTLFRTLDEALVSVTVDPQQGVVSLEKKAGPTVSGRGQLLALKLKALVPGKTQLVPEVLQMSNSRGQELSPNVAGYYLTIVN